MEGSGGTRWRPELSACETPFGENHNLESLEEGIGIKTSAQAGRLHDFQEE